MDDIKAAFEKFNDELFEFELVEKKLSKRHDIHAFLLLDSLVPACGASSMVIAVGYDEILLGVDLAELAGTAITEDQIRDLIRCGVGINGDDLCMAV